MEENFQHLIELLLKQSIPSITTVGTVKAVDTDKLTCDVEREDAPPLHSVRLHATEISHKSYVVIIPEVGSDVLCTIIDNDVNEAQVLSSSKPEGVKIKIAETTVAIDKEGVTINNGDLGGLIKIEELKSDLKKLNNYLDSLKNAISTGLKAVGVSTAASGTLGAQAFDTAISAAQLPSYSELENQKVKH
ncbi:MAG: hypothetical protein N4A72_06255 [Bacteroidales bacterium]|jgi:hypothetical protein|nr:hypothetical protein [Bacteroidales bacterium]